LSGFGFGNDHPAAAAFHSMGLGMAADRTGHFGWFLIPISSPAGFGFSPDEAAFGARGPESVNQLLIFMGICPSLDDQPSLGH